MTESQPNRELTAEELHLARWMLDHGEPEARQFLSQLERAQVSPWRCPCGCASFDFTIPSQPKPSGGMNLLADFVFGEGDSLSGIFIYQQSGILSGVEVYGLAGEAPKTLPTPEMLRPLSDATQSA